ncbi:hypothetical protein V8C42DRAFT_356142 [Trichoderma barbatum]
MTATKLAGLSTHVFVTMAPIRARSSRPRFATDVNELRGELLGRDYETYVRMAVLSHYGLTGYDMSNGWHA